MALSTVFHSINSPDNSLFSHSVLLVLSRPYWSFQQYISLYESVLQPWYKPKWLTELKTPINLVTNSVLTAGIHHELSMIPASKLILLLQDTTRLTKRPCYSQGSLCQDPAGNPTTRIPPNHRKETQTEVVWICLPFIRSGQNHLARHSGTGKKTKQTENEVGRHQGMDRPVIRQVTEGSGQRRLMEETGCEVICGAQATHAVKV